MRSLSSTHHNPGINVEFNRTRKLVHRLPRAARLSSIACIAMAFSTPAAAADFNPADTSVQMFRWKWNDIAKECTNWLGPQGYGAVQISPPHASRKLDFWYDVYQAVNYTRLDSRMGTEAELQAMINTCHAAKVRIYADVVVNQMADGAGTGTATDGSSWNAATQSYPHFSAPDFHAACVIQGGDYSLADRTKVTSCRLNNLPDLNTGASYVQGQIRNYLNKLVAMGVDGVRLDAAKHMAPGDIAGFLNGVSRTTKAGEPLWFTQEVIPDSGVKANAYLATGSVNEFHYVYAMKEMFQNVNGAAVADLPRFMGSPSAGWGGTWGFIPSDKATVFINNWDSERGEHAPSSLVASNFTGVPNDTQGTKRYQLANVLMLAWPYGAAQVHSGFRFTRSEQPPPAASPFDANGKPLINQAWDFIHRWPEISNMVGFRAATSGQGVDNFTTGTRNQIAFSRGNKGFVAINNDPAAWTTTHATGLPPGTYCNVINGQLNTAKTGCSGDAVVVPANGVIKFTLGSVNGATVPALALHANQKVGASTSHSTNGAN
jgi:alpha-amylase